jgi:hypothetical protein
MAARLHLAQSSEEYPMARQFPYLAATTVTVAAGVLTSFVRAASVPPTIGVSVPVGGRVSPMPAAPVRAALPGNAVNTPTSNAPAFSPGNPNVAVGATAAPAVVQSATYGQAGMNQPGQPSFGETFLSNQTAMGQPGQADFFEGTANPNVVQANEGIVPSNAYPNPSTPQTGVSSTATNALGFRLTQSPNTVGFFSGFGPGQPDFGFYAGFTTPR